jgi:hypothetical protein
VGADFWVEPDLCSACVTLYCSKAKKYDTCPEQPDWSSCWREGEPCSYLKWKPSGLTPEEQEADDAEHQAAYEQEIAEQGAAVKVGPDQEVVTQKYYCDYSSPHHRHCLCPPEVSPTDDQCATCPFLKPCWPDSCEVCDPTDGSPIVCGPKCPHFEDKPKPVQEEEPVQEAAATPEPEQGETPVVQEPKPEKKTRAKKPAPEKVAQPVQETPAAPAPQVQEATGDPLTDAIAKIKAEMAEKVSSYTKVIGNFLLAHLDAN